MRRFFASTNWIFLTFTLPWSYLWSLDEFAKNKEVCLWVLIPDLLICHIMILYLCKSVRVGNHEIKVSCLLGLHKKIFKKEDIVSAKEEDAGAGFKYFVIRDSKGQVVKIHPFAIRHYDELIERVKADMDDETNKLDNKIYQNGKCFQKHK